MFLVIAIQENIYFSFLFVVILIVNIYVFNPCWFEIILPSKSWYHSIVRLIQTFSLVIARVLFGCVSMICRDQVLEVKFFYIYIYMSKQVLLRCLLFICIYVYAYVYVYLCVCVYIHIYIYIYIYMNIYVYIYIYTENTHSHIYTPPNK